MTVADVLAGRAMWHVEQGHVLDVLRSLPSESVHCVVTSPPYWGLRAYGTEPQVWGGELDCAHSWTVGHPAGYRSSDTNPCPLQTAGNIGRENRSGQTCAICGAFFGELGSEPLPDLFVAHLVEVFREVRRTLRNDGVLFVNLGDSYVSTAPGTMNAPQPKGSKANPEQWANYRQKVPGLKPKDLCLIPWRFAIAAQEDGWWVRSIIPWCKTSPMPESVQDRPTSAWEPIFLLTKSSRYFYDADAVRQPSTMKPQRRLVAGALGSGPYTQNGIKPTRDEPETDCPPGGANLRNYWVLGPEPFPDAHFATFPTEIPRRCILAGCPEGGLVLDPFTGSGTTGMVALRLDRRFYGIELNPEYAEMARRRITNDAPMFNTPLEVHP